MKRKRIVFATNNEHKMVEIRHILSALSYEIVSLKDIGLEVDVVEDGKTFAENSYKKAIEISKYLEEDIVLADDSGLVIDYLGGEPGIYSSRYLGKDTPYAEKNRIIIDRLSGVAGEKRSARFVCNITAVLPDGSTLQYEGVLEGLIADKVYGENGFGYDPIFYVPEYDMTSAQMSSELKNKISHRGKALKGMFKLLKDKI